MLSNSRSAQGGATIRMGRIGRAWKPGCDSPPNGLKKTYTTPEGITYTYYYNKNNQFTAVHIPGSGQLSRGNFYWLQPQTLLLPGGSQVTLSYDDFLQVKERILQDPEQTNIAQALYDYDAVGDITAIDTEHGEYSFGYDSLYRLTDADYPLDVAANDEEFGYDGVGNRTTHTQATEEDEQERTSATYNSLNQLISQIQNGVETTFTYNANGHTATKTTGSDTTEYIYNHEERLIAVKKNGQKVGEYAYNPLGQRIKKTVNGQTTWYLYNDEGLAAEYNQQGQLIAEYHFTPYSTWMTEPLFQRKGGQVYYYQNDHLGTPQRMVNSTGEVVWEARYKAFGEAEIVTETVSNNLRFPGQYFDGETGLHHNYFRDYDSETGRYVQNDPISLGGGINTYGYVEGNPLSHTDPQGLMSIPIMPGSGNTSGWSVNAEAERRKLEAQRALGKNPTYCSVVCSAESIIYGQPVSVGLNVGASRIRNRDWRMFTKFTVKRFLNIISIYDVGKCIVVCQEDDECNSGNRPIDINSIPIPAAI